MMLVGYPFLAALEPMSEDCLFLDVLVPGKAVRGEAKDLPVLFWIFGGGYGMSDSISPYEFLHRDLTEISLS